MMALKDKIRALTIEQIEKVKPQGHCEFIEAIGEPIPVQVFLELFGLPVTRRAEFRAAVREHFASVPNGLHDSQQRLQKLVGVLEDTLVNRRDNPRDDLISLLWQATVDGRPVTLGDMRNYCVLLFIAGLDTVMNAMGFGARHLATDPALQEELRANPKLVPEAAEEFLRRYGIVKSPRIVARDLVYEGAPMKAGERVFLYNPAANLDPEEFPDPGAIDLHRENKAHITFAAGPHRCVGSHLARIELQTLYEEMLARLPTFRLDPDKPVRYKTNPVLGPKEVHLRWDS
jgi:cytochrome P450